MPKNKRDQLAIEMVNDRFIYADDGNKDYLRRAVENEELYWNYIDETDHPYLSNISLPWPYIITESYLGKCIQITAASMPYVHVVEDDDDSRSKARRVERDANMVLYKQKWPILAYNGYKGGFKHGTLFLWLKPWGRYNGIEMPILEIMNFFHVKVNPTILSLEDPDAYLGYETFLPLDYFNQFKDNPFYKNIDKIVPHQGDIFTEEEQSIRAFRSLPGLTRDKYSNLVKTWLYWDFKNFIILTGGDNVIRDDRENFIGQIPVKVIKPIPIENEFYGMSILEEGKDLFAEANENRNQFNDGANLMLNPQYIINRDVCDLKRRNIEARSGNIIWTSDIPNNAVAPLKQDWNLLAMCLKRQDSIYQDIMNYSNAFPQMRGQPSPGAAETATEFVGMRSAGELRSDTYNLLLSMMGVESIVEDIVEYKRKFMTLPSKFYYWPERKTQITMPEDYEGEFTFKAFSAFRGFQEIERKQLIEAMAMVFGGANGAFLPFVTPKTDEWLDRLLDSFPHIRSPEQLKLSEEEKMMAQAQSMMQQMMLPFAGKGGNEQPAMGEKAMRPMETEPNSQMGSMISNEMMRP